MQLLTGVLTGIPGIVAAMPAFIQNLDGGNLVIGVITLIAGMLGVAYLVLGMLATPVPATQPAEVQAYPAEDRFLVPLFLPIGVAVAVGLIILLISQILLVVPEAVATPIALAIALLILIACSVIATAPRITRGLVYTVVGVPLLLLVIAGGASGVYRFNAAQEEAQARAEQEANAPTTSPQVVTTDNKFSKTTINVPAGQSVTLTVTNNGLAIHNWHLLNAKDASGKDIATDLTQPGQKNTVTFTLSSAGSYKFQCDVHPTEMIGELKVLGS
jgi:plastocyanin